ncbi:MAG: crossover junction endodeoxyribonuclease RuvC [Candidatus Eisenbacteria bacterium]|nr:crossover junction endodeoxyribonuclease RuvC [Candidatus Latescibacterota bacterium]MBD3301692.1 crossover junction endodeoxyribonuclease RuvC [Candidatus Eisenbacteria bacterium]
MRIVLGLDPGSRRTGYGILRLDPDRITRVAGGVLRLDESRPFAERLPELRGALLPLIEAHRPGEAALETCFVARSARAALVLGHVRGVLLLLCLEAGLDVFEYAPAEVKRAACGTGAASKEQVQEMLRRLVPGIDRRITGDESDALAVAYCHLGRTAVTRPEPMRGLR